MPDYKTRNSFMTYQVYLKKRETTCHYNRGLYWMDPSGGGGSGTAVKKAITSFQKAICADPHNEDARYQLNLIVAAAQTAQVAERLGACEFLDCSGCQLINSKHS